MKTDPNNACSNVRQRLLWALVHDALAHPLMALTGYCKLSLWFHDLTSHKAWPRAQRKPWHLVLESNDIDRVHALERALRLKGLAFVTVATPGAMPTIGFRPYTYRVELV